MIRKETGTEATEVSFLIGAKDLNEATTDKMPLTTSLELFEAQSSDFTNQDPGFDCFQITGMGVEFFGPASTTVGTLRFQIDDVEIVAAPEPGALLLQLAALATAAGLARRRRGVR